MKRRTVLKRFAAGGVSTVALAGTSTVAPNSFPENFDDVEFLYRVTDDGLEKFQPDDSFDITDHCSSDPCCSCPDDCDPDCVCLTPC
jgi:hypothetical protein